MNIKQAAEATLAAPPLLLCQLNLLRKTSLLFQRFSSIL
jgi:hypothetical protein